MLLETKIGYDEDVIRHGDSVNLTHVGRPSSHTHLSSKYSMLSEAVSNGTSIETQQDSIARTKSPSPFFLAHYHHYPLMTRMIKEEVEESERMVQRLASWGLLRLKVANSTNEKTDTHNRRSEARQGDLELVLSRGRLRPTLFVKAHITLDEWSVSIPKWMRPIAYSGTTAGGEPFWRRLAHEKRHGIKGEYTRIDDKDKRIDKVGKTLMYVLHSRTRASQLRRDAMVAPTRRKS